MSIWVVAVLVAILLVATVVVCARRRVRRLAADDGRVELVNALLNREIERRARSEAEKARIIEQLEARNAEMERFIYTVSHDLKSPLVTIRGFLGMLRKDLAAEDMEGARRDIERVDAAALKMAQLLEELLELSRVGRLVHPDETVPAAELAREVRELLAAEIAAAKAEVEVAPDLPVLLGDRVRLRELYQNLVENALRFMGEEPRPRVELGWRRDGERTVLFVRDNGIGIDPRYHQRIFALFERLDCNREGTGVGLALVRRIVELHGGEVWVESAGLGQGSTFCFTLPTPGRRPGHRRPRSPGGTGRRGGALTAGL